MALTDAQRESVYEYLGYPTVTYLGNPSQTLRTILDNLTANTESRVTALLTKIGTSRSDIDAAAGRLKAAKVGDIELNDQEIPQRWTADYQLCRQLSILLGVPINDHPGKPRGGPEVLT